MLEWKKMFNDYYLSIMKSVDDFKLKAIMHDKTSWKNQVDHPTEYTKEASSSAQNLFENGKNLFKGFINNTNTNDFLEFVTLSSTRAHSVIITLTHITRSIGNINNK